MNQKQQPPEYIYKVFQASFQQRYSQCAVSLEIQLNLTFPNPPSAHIDVLMGRWCAGNVDLPVFLRAHLTCSLLHN